MKILLTNPGTQHSFHLARELNSRGCLWSFYTGAAFRSRWGPRISKYLPQVVAKALSTRCLSTDFRAKLKTKPLLELIALWRLRSGRNEQEVLQHRNDSFQRVVADADIRHSDVVIGADTASAILAERCRSLGRPF